MKVHSKIWLILGLAVLMTACSTDDAYDTGSETVVGFTANVLGAQDTRAVVDAGNLPDGSFFGVYAYSEDESIYTDARNSITFLNVKAAHDGTFGTAYWPSSGELTFHAYYPYNGAGVTPSFSRTTGTIGFKTPSKADTDLMYAKNSGSRTENNGTVSLKFNHLLAWLNIRAAVNNTSGKPQTLVVTGATLTSLTQGTYTITSSGTGSWATPTVTASLNTGPITKTVGSALSTVADFLIVPQNLKDASNSLVIDYTLNGADKTLTVAVADLPAMTASNSQGKKFVLDVTFNLTDNFVDVNFSTSVKQWTEKGQSVIIDGQYSLEVPDLVIPAEAGSYSVTAKTDYSNPSQGYSIGLQAPTTMAISYSGSDSGWISGVTVGGINGDLTRTITVTVLKNNGSTPREAKISYVQAGNMRKEIYVKQLGS